MFSHENQGDTLEIGAEIILYLHPANERPRYNVTSSLIS